MNEFIRLTLWKVVGGMTGGALAYILYLLIPALHGLRPIWLYVLFGWSFTTLGMVAGVMAYHRSEP